MGLVTWGLVTLPSTTDMLCPGKYPFIYFLSRRNAFYDYLYDIIHIFLHWAGNVGVSIMERELCVQGALTSDTPGPAQCIAFASAVEA